MCMDRKGKTKIPRPCATVTKVITYTRCESERVITRPLDEAKHGLQSDPSSPSSFFFLLENFCLSEARMRQGFVAFERIVFSGLALKGIVSV